MTKKSVPTRERILKAARHLFQQRGYYAIGTAEILEAARAPKGSMYHHFPFGKEQIAIEAVHAIRADLSKMMAVSIARKLSVAQLIRQLARDMATWLKASRWREGTMLTSTAIGSVPDLPKLHEAIRETFADWRRQLTQLLVTEGWNRAEASILAHTVIAGLEGAMVLARIDQDERALVKIADKLADMTEASQRR